MFTLIIPICKIDNSIDYRIVSIKNLIKQTPKDINIIIVHQIKPKDKKLNFTGENVLNIYVNSEGIFNKSWLNNIGVKYANTKYIILSESDISIDLNYFLKLKEYVNKNNYDWFFAWNRIIYYEKDMKKISRDVKPFKGGPEGGLVCHKKDFYWKMGGANEWLAGLGGIDNEMARRSEYLTKTYHMFQYKIEHNWHPESQLKYDKQRDWNKKLYKFVVNNPYDMINLQIKLIKELGNVKKPICDTYKLEFKNSSIKCLKK